MPALKVKVTFPAGEILPTLNLRLSERDLANFNQETEDYKNLFVTAAAALVAPLVSFCLTRYSPFEGDVNDQVRKIVKERIHGGFTNMFFPNLNDSDNPPLAADTNPPDAVISILPGGADPEYK